MSAIRFFVLFFLLVCVVSCSDSKKKENVRLKKRQEHKAKIARLNKVSALPETFKSPANNPMSNEKTALGKLLFFDPILSGDKDVSCATCHHPSTGYAEFLDLSIGPNAHGLGSKRKFKTPNDIPFVKRNAPTVLNTAYNSIDTRDKYDPETAAMFWDSRIESLEKQALEPIKAFEEMRGKNYTEDEILNVVVNRLRKIPEYKRLFNEVFEDEEPITVENLGKAIAAFERSLVSNNSRFDQYMRGDENAIHLSEKEGFSLFRSVGCVNCHNGPMFSDYKPHVIGAPDNNKLKEIDRGIQDTFAFRTPTLRNLRFTAPYMHNGSLNSLQRVLEFYEDIANGKERNKNVTKDMFDPLVDELKLTVKEMSLIISFLNTLNDENFDKEPPKSVPSGLPVGGNIE